MNWSKVPNMCQIWAEVAQLTEYNFALIWLISGDACQAKENW